MVTPEDNLTDEELTSQLQHQHDFDAGIVEQAETVESELSWLPRWGRFGRWARL